MGAQGGGGWLAHGMAPCWTEGHCSRPQWVRQTRNADGHSKKCMT
ncbi:hypothetical protein ppKF707_2276 [Metapseudomonas furukawaii]|uniref:Uncharacterized protein n=1 Tax=Metapseudomonas furukawaii TaxID=1149133 RepID=A0AAD1FD64_METFU|nr:hypothetical protein ppKF707_2276 [Pseudomonas furukawaii]BAU71816.1 hypothetical protein KF707C_1280 [Pseudomonas furukawaii]